MESPKLAIRNANVFDSVNARITGPMDIAVKDGRITSLTPSGSTEFAGEVDIDGTGKTLMPGLIDAHWHTTFATIATDAALLGEVGYVFAKAVVGARETLLRGFTTVRDVGGPVFGIKQAIDEDVIPGPRIFPAGAFISQSGGHGDFRLPNETPRGVAGNLSYTEIIGAAIIADGEAEVLRGAREVLRRGASQLK
ncbi:MAG: amidohydrolase family protein, partial [Actinomycetia bacterium]|nr:amidohydrolase family protein [Actinomycetes bacterium]